jgi:NAD(P)-dependent dehydrogenase (short-subunit alcohol dehydrogenase family)
MPDPTHLTVIVTGGARGLGRAMTLALLRSGARVAVADLPVSAPEVAELKDIARKEGAGDRVHSIECDVTRWQDCTDVVNRTIQHFGSLHGLVNDAAIGMQNIGAVMTGKRTRFYEVDAEVWKKSIDTNVNGPFQMAKAITPHLVGQGFGRIVNITTSHFTMVMEGFTPYGPTKAAMEAATVAWSKDLAGTGVTVNALLPGGAANTRMIPQSEITDRSTLVQPEVMMAPIVWLMSPRSNGVTGRRIIGKDWDAERLQRTPADQVGDPAGW